MASSSASDVGYASRIAAAVSYRLANAAASESSLTIPVTLKTLVSPAAASLRAASASISASVAVATRTAHVSSSVGPSAAKAYSAGSPHPSIILLRRSAAASDFASTSASRSSESVGSDSASRSRRFRPGPTVPNRASASASVIRPTVSLEFVFSTFVDKFAFESLGGARLHASSVPGAPAAALTTSVAPSS